MVQKSGDDQLIWRIYHYFTEYLRVQVVQLILMAFLLIQLPRHQDGEDSAVSSVRTGVVNLIFILWGRDSLLHISK